MKKSYREIAIEAYGNQCEFEGCDWSESNCDVHHINYRDQQALEKEIRKSKKALDTARYHILLEYARSRGFYTFDEESAQLSKDDSVHNLAVLCPNHHRYVHDKDLGNNILKYIPERKKGEQ